MSLMLIAEVIIKVVGYTTILYGIWLLVGQYVIGNAAQYVYQDIKRKQYVKRLHRVNKINYEKKVDNHTLINKHITTLLAAVKRKSLKSKKNSMQPTNFYILSLFILGVSFMLIFLMLHDILISLAFASTLMMLPYVILRMRLTNKRLKNSMAFMNNFHIIVQAYNTSAKSAYHMVRNITEELDDKELKNTFIKLLASMQQDHHPDDFRKEIMVFSYSINSSFAIRFGNLLSRSYLGAADISVPLTDLNRDIMGRKNDLENEKSLNVETKLLGYLPIVTLPLFLFCAWRVSTMYSFWSLFNYGSNIMVFLIALVLTGVSLFSIIVFSKPRSDV